MSTCCDPLLAADCAVTCPIATGAPPSESTANAMAMAMAKRRPTGRGCQILRCGAAPGARPPVRVSNHMPSVGPGGTRHACRWPTRPGLSEDQMQQQQSERRNDEAGRGVVKDGVALHVAFCPRGCFTYIERLAPDRDTPGPQAPVYLQIHHTRSRFQRFSGNRIQ
jgi:hypothetical protein